MKRGRKSCARCRKQYNQSEMVVSRKKSYRGKVCKRCNKILNNEKIGDRKMVRCASCRTYTLNTDGVCDNCKLKKAYGHITKKTDDNDLIVHIPDNEHFRRLSVGRVIVIQDEE